MKFLRAMKRSDLPALMPLCQAHAKYEGLNFSKADQIARWQQLFFGPQPRLFGWVVEVDGTLQGYMSVTIDTATWSAKPFVYLDCLYLAPSVRRQGFGRLMMEALQQFAREHGCPEIQWQTPPDNDLGRAFYNSLPVQERAKSRFTLEVRHEPELV